MSREDDIGRIYGRGNENAEDDNNGYTIFILSIIALFFIVFMVIMIFIANKIEIPGYEDGRYQHYLIGAIILVHILIALRTYLAYWIIKDSMERGMSSPPSWGLFVFLYPIVAMVLYYFFRPEGDLQICHSCGKRMSEILHECPHCRYRKETVKKKSWRRKNGR